MYTTASPRLYWLRHREGDKPFVEVIQEEGRRELKPYPFALRSENDEFAWGERKAGTKLLAMAILWDVFQSRELVTSFYRSFSDDIVEDARSAVYNVIPMTLVMEWFKRENEGRLAAASLPRNCGGCPQ